MLYRVYCFITKLRSRMQKLTDKSRNCDLAKGMTFSKMVGELNLRTDRE